MFKKPPGGMLGKCVQKLGWLKHQTPKAVHQQKLQNSNLVVRLQTVHILQVKNQRKGSGLVKEEYTTLINKKVVRPKRTGRGTPKSRRVAAAVEAYKQDKLLLLGRGGSTRKGALLKVTSFSISQKGKLKINYERVADYEKDRKVKVGGRPFMYNAAKMTNLKMNSIFRKNAQKQLQKFTR